jgi:hypothetical protein
MKNEWSLFEAFDRVWGHAFPNPVENPIENERASILERFSQLFDDKIKP